MEYYSAVKKNETVPLAATWGDLERVTVSEGSAEHKCHIIIHAESKTAGTNELVYKTERDS